MKRHGPVHVIVHAPKNAEGQRELARRVSEVHADAVYKKINSLNCPGAQKVQLLDAIIANVRNRDQQRTRIPGKGSSKV